LLLPDEMFLEGLLAKKPLTKLMPEIGMGVDFARADFLLARRSQRTPAQWKTTRKRYFRFRTDAFVETTGGVTPPLQLTAWPAAGAAGHRRRCGPRRWPARATWWTTSAPTAATSTSRTSPPAARSGGYSLPRHAGTTYFLAEVYRFTKAAVAARADRARRDLLGEPVGEAAASARCPTGASWLRARSGERKADLGSTALGVVALAEYQRATDDRRYLPEATALAEWILWMQRPDGSFRHIYDVSTGVADDKTMLLYFSGEAALALARMYAITGDVRYAQASERALDWLVGWYDFFIGGFLYGEEHWTCIAAEALVPYKQKASYRDFCDGLARFWGQSQAHPGDYPDQPDLVGSHNLTPFVMPHNTPAGSHTEARISTYLLGAAAGRPHAWLRADIVETLGYLMAQQIGPHNDYALAPAARAFGALATNPVDRTVRIDYVQHVCSAMIRGAALIE
jgi:hypothetical protein